MRKTRVVPERDKKPNIMNWGGHLIDLNPNNIELSVKIDYDKKLIKQLLNNNQ